MTVVIYSDSRTWLFYFKIHSLYLFKYNPHPSDWLSYRGFSECGGVFFAGFLWVFVTLTPVRQSIAPTHLQYSLSELYRDSASECTRNIDIHWGFGVEIPWSPKTKTTYASMVYLISHFACFLAKLECSSWF